MFWETVAIKCLYKYSRQVWRCWDLSLCENCVMVISSLPKILAFAMYRVYDGQTFVPTLRRKLLFNATEIQRHAVCEFSFACLFYRFDIIFTVKRFILPSVDYTFLIVLLIIGPCCFCWSSKHLMLTTSFKYKRNTTSVVRFWLCLDLIFYSSSLIIFLLGIIYLFCSP